MFTRSRAHTYVHQRLRSHCVSGGHTVWSTQNRMPLLLRTDGDVISVLSMNIYSRIFPIIIVFYHHLHSSVQTCLLPVHTCGCSTLFMTRKMLTWRCCTVFAIFLYSRLRWRFPNGRESESNMTTNEITLTHLLLFCMMLFVLFVVDSERNFQMVRYTKMITDLSEFFKKYPETGQPGQPLHFNEEYREVCYEFMLYLCFFTYDHYYSSHRFSIFYSLI